MENKNVSKQTIAFKQICMDLYREQTTTHTYDKIVNLVLNSEQGKLLSAEGGLSLHEVGYVFDISRERVRQIRDIAIKKLKSPSKKENMELRKYIQM